MFFHDENELEGGAKFDFKIGKQSGSRLTKCYMVKGQKFDRDGILVLSSGKFFLSG